MEVSFWIIVVISILMYIEGASIGFIGGTAAKLSKRALAITVIFWPVALPILARKLYKEYWPLISNLLPLLVGPVEVEKSGDES